MELCAASGKEKSANKPAFISTQSHTMMQMVKIVANFPLTPVLAFTKSNLDDTPGEKVDRTEGEEEY